MQRISPNCLLGVVVIFLSGIQPGCGRKDQAAAASRERPAPLVVVQPAQRQEVVHALEAIGELEPEEDTTVSAEVGGAVLKLHFSEGDAVKPDTVLAEINPTDHALEAEKKQAGVAIAKSNLATAKAVVKSAASRVTEAKARVTAAEAEVVSAGAAVKQAKADIVVAEAHLSASNTGLAGAQAGRTQAQARVKAAEAGLKLAKDGLDRKTALKKDGFATEEDFLAAQVGHEAALAALEEAKAGLEVAEAACQDAEARVTVSKAQMGQAGQKFEQAESHLVQANAQVALATAGIAGAESQSEAAGADTGRAEAAVREAEAGFGLAQDKLDKAKVKAGIEGKVVARHVSTGEWVNPGSPIARIVDDRTLKVRFTLPESEAGRVAVGMPARFSVKSYPGKTFEASIFFVSAQGDPSTRAVEVKARFKNDKGELRAGGYCRVAVGVATSPDSLVVPETAVLPTEEGFVAYVLDGEVARKRSVKPGLRSRGNVEVLDGLKAGETLVVRGAHSLADGMKVKVTAAAGAQETPAGTPGQPHIP